MPHTEVSVLKSRLDWEGGKDEGQSLKEITHMGKTAKGLRWVSSADGVSSSKVGWAQGAGGVLAENDEPQHGQLLHQQTQILRSLSAVVLSLSHIWSVLSLYLEREGPGGNLCIEQDLSKAQNDPCIVSAY